jgi:hypothetical protein
VVLGLDKLEEACARERATNPKDRWLNSILRDGSLV